MYQGEKHHQERGQLLQTAEQYQRAVCRQCGVSGAGDQCGGGGGICVDGVVQDNNEILAIVWRKYDHKVVHRRRSVVGV